MKLKLKRALAGLAVVTVAAGIAPFLTATPAAAAGTLTGAAEIRNAGGNGLLQSGGGATDFTLRPPTGAACPGDGVAGYRVQTFFVANAVDASQLQFTATGPTLPGNPTAFVQPMYTVTGDPIADQAPNSGDGVILGLPNMDFDTFTAGQIPAGVYKLGIACTFGGPSTTQMLNFYQVLMTITSDTTSANRGNAEIHWENGTAPAAPVITALTPAETNASTGQVAVAFTNATANPVLTGCTITVGTSAGGSQFGSFPGTCTSPRTITGLTYGQPYFVRMTSANSVGSSPVSNELSATTTRAAVAGLSATPSPNTVALDWNDAANIGTDSYNIARCTLPATSPCTSASSGFVASVASADSAETFTGLAAGQVYTFTVTYGAPGTSLASSVQSTPLSNSILLQDITVGRPNGALVLTQVCGKWDEMAAETSQFGYPNGLPLSAASANGTAPTAGGSPDGQFNEYPYPENADGTANPTYPTQCGIALGNAKLITKGGSANGAGQFFAADGRLNQITVVDTRDTDPGWTINFTMSALSNAASSTAISGNQLGWTVQKTDTPAFQDGSGNNYDQTVNYTNQTLAPNGQGAAGAGTAHSVIQAPDATPGLGIATLDARIKLLIPIHAKNGTYSGTLTINAL